MPEQPPLGHRTILAVVSVELGVPQAAMIGPSHMAHLVFARRVAMWLMSTLRGWKPSVIGRLLGGRDRGTIVAGITAMERARMANPPTAELLDRLAYQIIVGPQPAARMTSHDRLGALRESLEALSAQREELNRRLLAVEEEAAALLQAVEYPRTEAKHGS